MIKPIIIIALLLAPCAVMGQTISQVSGTFDNGESVTITGSGFGTKATPAPKYWTTFDSATNGTFDGLPVADVAGTGYTITYHGVGGSVTSSPALPYYSTSNMRNGTQNLRVHGTAGYGSGDQLQGIETESINPSGTKLYMSMWMRFSWGDAPRGSGNQVQVKTWRMGNSNGDWNIYPTMPMEATDETSGNINTRLSYRPASSNSCTLPPWPDDYYHLTHNDDYADNTWARSQIVFDPGIKDADAGYCYLYINGVLSDDNIVNEPMYCGDDAQWEEILFGDWLGNVIGASGASNYILYDDIYIDDTWQRVEVGNASTYGACTHFEAQPPTAWNDTGITVTLNTGTFESGSTVYVFVTDGNNDHSSGTAIVLGNAVSTPEVMTAPTNLTVTSP